jgi:hypothetical protein
MVFKKDYIMKVQMKLTLVYIFILQVCGFAQNNVVPVEPEGNITQSENSVSISRSNPKGDPSTSQVYTSSNTSNWVQSTAPCETVYTWHGVVNYFNYYDCVDDGLPYLDLISSNTGGQSWNWTSNVYSGVPGTRCDPSVCQDLNNNFYLAALSSDFACVNIVNWTNTWNTVTVACTSPNEDKPDLWIDNKINTSTGNPNANNGNLYLAWVDEGPSPAPIMFAYSYDKNGSWSTPTDISNGLNGVVVNEGPNIKTGPNGEVYACWATYPCNPSPTNRSCTETQLAFAYSIPSPNTKDGGQNWSAPYIIRGIDGTTAQSGKCGEYMRMNSFPSMAVNQLNGDIYIVWTDFNNGNGYRCRMIVSTDGGLTFPTYLTVGNPNGMCSQWFPWISCDETSGAIAVIYYGDFGDAVGTYVSYSYDEGQTWSGSEDYEITGGNTWDGQPLQPDADPDANTGPSLNYAGDYNGIDLFKGWCVPVWSDKVSGGNNGAGSCNGETNLLEYTNPFSILCNQNPWSFCPTFTSNPNPYYVSDYGFFESQQNITVAGTTCPNFTVLPTGYCTMQAVPGQTIYMEPGFTAQNGCYFHASIANCTETPRAPEHHPPHDSVRSTPTVEQPVTNNNSSDGIAIVPNPNNGEFYIRLNPIGTDQDEERGKNGDDRSIIWIYNTLGQLIYQAITRESMIYINIKGNPAGMYFVKVQEGDDFFNKKIIIE